MPFTNPATPVTARVVFNSGTIDFGSNRIVDLDSATLGIEWTMAPLYVVGSIIPQAYNRHTQKITLTGKIKSFAAEIANVALGSSATGNPVTLYPLDGQPTLQSPVATFFDANGKEFQYQFSGAMFKSFKTNVKMEDYADLTLSLKQPQ
jgi:hypothetical protein